MLRSLLFRKLKSIHETLPIILQQEDYCVVAQTAGDGVPVQYSNNQSAALGGEIEREWLCVPLDAENRWRTSLPWRKLNIRCSFRVPRADV